MAQLADLGIDLDAVTQQLQDDGVAAFAGSFDQVISSVAGKRQRLQRERQKVIVAGLYR